MIPYWIVALLSLAGGGWIVAVFVALLTRSRRYLTPYLDSHTETKDDHRKAEHDQPPRSIPEHEEQHIDERNREKRAHAEPVGEWSHDFGS
jgi:hypothetical protein